MLSALCHERGAIARASPECLRRLLRSGLARLSSRRARACRPLPAPCAPPAPRAQAPTRGQPRRHRGDAEGGQKFARVLPGGQGERGA